MSEIHLVDLFWTIQGEGANAGRRALFVRMPFCNLKCSWCDTEFSRFDKWPSEKFIDFAKSEPCRFAVITGGEPMLHKHTKQVIDILKSLGFEIACETNGTASIVNGVDFVTVSPKRDASPPYYIHEDANKSASEFKYVVDSGFDFHILDRHDTSDGRRYSLSPEFGEFNKNINNILEYVAKNPSWRISLQTHKWINVK